MNDDEWTTANVKVNVQLWNVWQKIQFLPKEQKYLTKLMKGG